LRALLLLCCLLSPMVQAADMLLILDDIGNNGALGDRALQLKGPINLAFLPHTPHATRLAKEAHQLGHGVMLHAPMANQDGKSLGKGGLYPDMSKDELQQELKRSLANIPQVQGVNNHMGSLLTEKADAMSWVMEVVQQQGLYFIDSLTSSNSVAYQQAQALGIPAMKRHVFLDNDTDEQALLKQFSKAMRVAKKQGKVVLIGHPYPETLAFLEKNLSLLDEHNIQLKRLDTYFQEKLWQPFHLPNNDLSIYQLQ